MINLEVAAECIEFLREEYPDVVKILWNEKFYSLKEYPRHKFTNTYDHSVRVAVGAALIANRLGADVESAIRVGLLHDLCFVNYYERSEHKGWYLFYHPKEAAANADELFGLNRVEIRAIKGHMFPLTLRVPTSKISLALTLSDKMIAVYEGLYCINKIRALMCNIGMRQLNRAYNIAMCERIKAYT